MKIWERLSTSFPLLLLGLLAALTFWLANTVQTSSDDKDARLRHEPDYIIDNFVTIRMGPDGLPLHKLEAERMQHYPDDDSTHLIAPRFAKIEHEREILGITAERARVSSGGDSVDFVDNVRAVRAPTGNRGEIILTTEFLHVRPDDNFARTDLSVTVVEGNSKVTAIGLELDNNTKTVKLLSNVRGTYVKTK